MGDVFDIKYAASAVFSSAKDLYDAAGKVKEKGYTKMGMFFSHSSTRARRPKWVNLVRRFLVSH